MAEMSSEVTLEDYTTVYAVNTEISKQLPTLYNGGLV